MSSVQDCCCVLLPGEIEAQAHFTWEIEGFSTNIDLSSVVIQDNPKENPVDLLRTLPLSTLTDICQQCRAYVHDVIEANQVDVFDYEGDR